MVVIPVCPPVCLSLFIYFELIKLLSVLVLATGTRNGNSNQTEIEVG